MEGQGRWKGEEGPSGDRKREPTPLLVQLQNPWARQCRVWALRTRTHELKNIPVSRCRCKNVSLHVYFGSC